MSIFSSKPKTSKKDAAKAEGEVVASKGRVLKGIVASTKMKDTIVVVVTRYFKHPRYGKFLSTRKRFKAHDEGNKCVEGETVEIRECRPISKDKRFTVVR
jgi:small subunit ribosomal protein S17